MGTKLFFAAAACSVSLLMGCGGPGGSGFNPDGGGSDAATQDEDPIIEFPDASVEAAPPCVGLKCQQVTCSSGKTTVSGTVWDPAGRNPLYNVVVYVPNSTLDPIPHGPKCDSCGGANISGSPVVTAITDPYGKFVLENVPVGTNIPLVIQAGKWRRKFTIGEVKQCVDNPMIDPSGTPPLAPLPVPRALKLPRNKSEGDMPLIALTGGCDPIHTLMQKIGIDPAEFTPGSGNGMVRVYSGKNNYNGGVSGATDAYAFYGNKTELFKYDIMINECECSPYPRDAIGNGYANVAAYLNAGGRVFNSHYHLNFYGEQGKADAMLQNAANWTLWGGSYPYSAPYLIDTTFPKGKAMDQWVHNLKQGVTAWTPQVTTSPVGQLNTSNVGDIGLAKPGLSQRWIYPTSGNSTVYLSINMPTNVPADQRCGRAVGSDIHVGNGSLTTMTEQEAALEFMLFDLASRVIDDSKPPVPPVPN
ncbi:hypothetical protein BH09MYX1_BH09MYX1_21680 [soil metagenome]